MAQSFLRINDGLTGRRHVNIDPPASSYAIMIRLVARLNGCNALRAVQPKQRPSATLLPSSDSATSSAASTTIWNEQSGLKQPGGMAAETSTEAPATIIGVFTDTGETVPPTAKLTVVCEAAAGATP